MRRIVLFTLLTLFAAPSMAVTRTVSNPSELSAAIAAAMPGDIIVMKNGFWTNVIINFNSKATASEPITLRAETPGAVILNGASSLTFAAPYLIVEGLQFKGGALSSGQIVKFNSHHCRLTNTAIIDYNPPSRSTSYYWVNFDGEYNRVDNCYFKGKNHHQPAVGNDFSGSRYNTVDHCYFKDMKGSGNGSEIFRIWGYGRNEELGTDGAFFTIEYNLFDAADGEGLEMISLKSNRNFVRYNTIKNTKGEITLRSGNYNTIEGNFIFGNNKLGSRGIRITGQYHKIINNYIQDITESGIVVYAGEYIDTYLTPNYQPILRSGTPLGRVPAYGQVKHAVIAHNTIVNAGGSGIEMGAAYKASWSTSQRVLLPEHCIVANNVIVKNGGTAIRSPKQDINPPLDIFTFQPNTYEGNVIHGGTVSMNPAPASGITILDPQLSLSGGLYRPAVTSPLIDAGSGSHVVDDMDGQLRENIADIGADESSAAAVVRRPLAEGDVGPEWMRSGIPPDPPQPDPNDAFDITDNGGLITAQYTNTSKPTENFPSLIDNKTSTKYYISNKTNLWVQYRSSVPAIVVRYTITSANDVPTRDPKNWSLQASNNGTSWTTLDTRSNEVFASRFLTRTFTFENSTAYLYYRLQITANSGHAGTQFAEWELYQRKIQTITFADIEPKTYGDEPFEVSASASSELDVTLEVVSGPATIDEDLLTITGAGAVTVRASQPGNEHYFPASAELTFTVQKAAQIITFQPVETKTYGDAPFELVASVDSGLPLAYAVVSGPATLSGATVSITGAGDVTVQVSQEGNENYLPATAQQTFTVNKAPQTVSFEPLLPVNQSDIVQLQAAASSGLPVTFEVVSGHGALADQMLAFTGEGEVVIEATQPGNENYLPAEPVQQTILVYANDSKYDAIRMIIHPNPTKWKLKVKLDNKKDEEYTFVIYDRFGKPIASSVIPKSHKMFEVDFDMSDADEGLYYLWVSDGTDITVRRIIKEQ